MKKIIRLAILAALVALLANSMAFAAGSCVLTNTERVFVENRAQRMYFTLTCTGASGIAAYTFSPQTYGVRGWFLFNVSTDPGTSAPTDQYDITLLVDGEDIAGGLLLNRSATATQTVMIAPTTIGPYMVDQPIVITFANETAESSTIVMKLRFTTN